MWAVTYSVIIIIIIIIIAVFSVVPYLTDKGEHIAVFKITYTYTLKPQK